MSKHHVSEANLVTPAHGFVNTSIAAADIGTMTVTRTAAFDHNVDLEGRASVIVDETQLILGYDAPNRASFDVSAAGVLTIDATGHSIVTAAHDVVTIANATDTTTNATGALLVTGGIYAAKAIRANDFLFRIGFEKDAKVDLSASLMGVSGAPATLLEMVSNTWNWTLTAAADVIRCSGLLPNCRMAGSPVTVNIYWAGASVDVDDVNITGTYNFTAPGAVVAAVPTIVTTLTTPGVAFQTVKTTVGTWTPATDTDLIFHCQMTRTGGGYAGHNLYILGVELIVVEDKTGGI